MRTLIKNVSIVNEGKIYTSDVLIEDERIKQISKNIDIDTDKEIDASGKYLLPGLIDDQVHFREPGLTYKANIYSESKAAVSRNNLFYGNAKYKPSISYTSSVRRKISNC